MADFVKFGADVVSMAGMCAGNCNKSNVAAFLVMQQSAIQEKRIKDRLEGNKAKSSGGGGGQKQGAGGGVAVSDPAITGEASGAMARLQAMLANKKR